MEVHIIKKLQTKPGTAGLDASSRYTFKSKSDLIQQLEQEFVADVSSRLHQDSAAAQEQEDAEALNTYRTALEVGERAFKIARHLSERGIPVEDLNLRLACCYSEAVKILERLGRSHEARLYGRRVRYFTERALKR